MESMVIHGSILIAKHVPDGDRPEAMHLGSAGSKKKGAASTAALLIIAADCFLDKSSGLLLTHKSSVDVDACLFCRRLP